MILKKSIKELREHENAVDERDYDLAVHEAKKFVYLFHKTFTKYHEKKSEDLDPEDPIKDIFDQISKKNKTISK